MDQKANTHIVVVDSSVVATILIKEVLRSHGYQVEIFTESSKALDYLRLHKVDIIVSRYSMPEISGVMLLCMAELMQPWFHGIVVTANQHEATDIPEGFTIIEKSSHFVERIVATVNAVVGA